MAPRQRSPRPGREGLAVDHAVRQTQSLAHHADLVLEEELQGLYQCKLQILRQAAHVVVGLDGPLSRMSG